MKQLSAFLWLRLAMSVMGAVSSGAQTTTLLHSFTGAVTDGDAPNSLIEAQDGNYYGTTAFGGSEGSCTDNDGNTVGCGTVFKLSNGTVTVLYSFSGGADGGNPTGLIQGPDGNLYGTTAFGGLVSSSTTTNPNCGTVGCGVIFKINPSQPPAAGQLVPVYTFSGASDPTVTTPAPPDGAYPNALSQGAGGVFYGTSIPCSGCNKSSYGFLFSFTPGASTPFVTLSTFGNVDKQENQSALDYPNTVIQTSATTLYGTTLLGGDTNGCLNTGSGWGCGGVFTYILSGTNAGLENDVCYFGQNNNVPSSTGSSVRSESTIATPHLQPETIVVQSSGRFPANAAKTWTFDTAPMTIALGGDTHIYGASPAFCVTYAPGTDGPATLSYTPVCSGPSGSTYSFPATVFQCIPPTAPVANPSSTSLPTGFLNTLYSFTDSGDGGGSLQGLMLASNGDYYGTSGVYTFDLTPTQMANFTASSSTTSAPLSSLSPFYSTLTSDTTSFSPNSMIQGSDGNFYGTTATGGSTATNTPPGDGAIFKVSTSSLSPPVQLSFSDSSITLGNSTTLNWTIANAYSLTAQQCYAFVTSGGTSAGAWSGLQAGTLSGSDFGGSQKIQPTASGTFTYALTCGGTVTGTASLQVNPGLSISPTTLPAVTAETPYSETLMAGGGSGTGYKFSVTTGASSLTALGLSLSSAGVFSGTPTAGTATFTVQLTDSLSDTTSQAYTLTVNKATPTVSVWPTAGAIIYGQTLASSTLTGGTASVGGTFAWTTPSTAPAAGTPSENVTFTPTDATDYDTVTSSVTLAVNKATPTVSVWPTASAITVGQTLASSTLSGGTASVGGTFAWTTPSTEPAAGTPSESVTFTPTLATDYNTVPGTVMVTVNAAPGFTLSASANSVSVAQGGSGTSTITVTDVGGFTGSVSLATTGLPSGVTSSFAAGTSPGTQVLTLTVSTSAQITSAPVTVTVTGTSGALSAATSISLTITAQPSFTAGSGGTTSMSIAPGASTGNTGTISIAGRNGFAGTVNLSCSVSTSMAGVNDMPSCSLNPPSVTISGATAQTSTLTVTTTPASSAETNVKKLIWPTGGTTLALVVLLVVPRRRRNWLAMVGMLLLCLAIGAVGCGGGGGSTNGNGGNPGTTAGTYTITVTGTSGTVAATVGTVTVTIQ
jgi:Putative Ig domain